MCAILNTRDCGHGQKNLQIPLKGSGMKAPFRLDRVWGFFSLCCAEQVKEKG